MKENDVDETDAKMKRKRLRPLGKAAGSCRRSTDED